MAAMQALGPEMKKLQQKYKGAENRAQLNEEMMKLYKEHKVNPASGCLPMLLQLPAFLVLYDVIRGITNTVQVHGHTVAEPRYIPHNTAMYHDIIAANGALNSFGMDFAKKLLPFSSHSSVWAALPYLFLVLASIALQYLQMSRLSKRNPAASANPQAAMLQKYMPIVFGLIYLNIPAAVNVYFIVSSAIRIGTQEVLFRRGIVGGPPVRAEEKENPARPPKPGPTGQKSGTSGTGTRTGRLGRRRDQEADQVNDRVQALAGREVVRGPKAADPSRPGTVPAALPMPGLLVRGPLGPRGLPARQRGLRAGQPVHGRVRTGRELERETERSPPAGRSHPMERAEVDPGARGARPSRRETGRRATGKARTMDPGHPPLIRGQSQSAIERLGSKWIGWKPAGSHWSRRKKQSSISWV